MEQSLDFLPGPCLRSGHCCKTIACWFGEWDAEKHQCRFLEVSETHPGYEIYACGKKTEIDALPETAGTAINPGFGRGCCMPLFNANRRAIYNGQTSREGE